MNAVVEQTVAKKPVTQSAALYAKMVNEAVGATKAVFGVIKQKRGGTFKFADCKPYVDAVKQMKRIEGQSKEVFDLHIESVKAHFDILMGLTDTIRPEDDPFIEHFQTPPILELLYEADPAFKARCGSSLMHSERIRH